MNSPPPTGNQPRIAALILAAGESTRMGRLKQLLPWAGLSLIDWQVVQMRDAGVDDVVVVLGHDAEAVRAGIQAPDARIVVNQSYREGRASSLRAGAWALEDSIGAVLILSVDQPRPSWLSRRLIDRWRETSAPIVSPRFSRRFGHPVLVAGSLLPELRAVDEASLGLRAVIQRHAATAEAVPIANDAIDVDLNTPADYAAALQSFNSDAWADTPAAS
jgi:molybdenum cofactor cytidylyltransferase